jgi:hypothetical protein
MTPKKKADKELKAAYALYQEKIADKAKAEQQRTAEAKKKECKAKAERLAATRALKQQERNAATSQKSHNTPNNSKRKTKSDKAL